MMIKTKLSYLKWAAVSAVLMLTFVPALHSSLAKNETPSVPAVDLSNERRVIAKYSKDLGLYEKQAAELSKRARLVSTDLSALETRSTDLKTRLSGVQSSVSEIINKLKAANEWNDIDKSILANITDSRVKSFLQEESFQQLLSESSTGLTSRRSEIDTPLLTLRQRLTSQYRDGEVRFVNASFVAPAPLKFFSLSCSVAGLQMRLEKRVTGTISQFTLHDTYERCHEEGSTNPF